MKQITVRETLLKCTQSFCSRFQFEIELYATCNTVVRLIGRLRGKEIKVRSSTVNIRDWISHN